MDERRPHEELDVWRFAMELGRDVYLSCEELPKDQRYGLSSRLRRAAVPLPNHVADGSAIETKKELARFLDIGQGCIAELETQL